MIAALDADDPRLPAIARWINETWSDSHGYSIAETSAWLRDIAEGASQAAIIAIVAGQPIGVGLLVENDLPEPSDCGPWLSSLLVVPEWRRKGIGARLIETVAGTARTLRTDVLYLHCRPGPLPGYYAKRGFVDIGPLRFGQSEHRLMRRPLTR